MPNRFFSSPVFANDEVKTRQARYVFNLSLATSVLLGAVLLSRLATAGSLSAAMQYHDVPRFLGMFIAALFVHLLVRKGAVTAASLTLIFGGWLAMTIQAYNAGNVQDTALAAYLIIFMLAAVLLERHWLAYLVLISILTAYLLALFQNGRFIIPQYHPPFIAASYLSIILLLGALLIWHIFSDFNAIIEQVNREHEAAETARSELEALNANLEKRVTERTAALQQESDRARRRARQMEAISEIAQTIVRVQNPEQLLASIVQQISEKLGFYHVGIFLLDERNEFAILQAANSEGGQRMLQRRHRLPVESTSLVGYTAQTQKARIALDVGVDAVHFENPDLPDTRAEMTLPLVAGEKTIGVLDIQSTEANAFSQEDIATLNILANQVAVAIENARLFEQTRQALVQAQKIYQEFIRQDWRALRDTLQAKGYRYDGAELRPLRDDGASLADAYRRPIVLHGQTIGIIEVRRKGRRKEILPAEQTLVAEAAERIAAALDNARLLDELQRRAAREQLVGQISDKIFRTTSLENVLDITAEELGALLPDSSISIQISPISPAESKDGEADA